ncbi:MAG: radical SAM protein [Nitrospirota bacterium]|nr:radical SAM protein [Nitrospirota bacterium]
MKYFLTKESVLKWLEIQSVYHIKNDDLYELDDDSFNFLRSCSSNKGCNAEHNELITYCLKEGILTTDKVSVKRPPLIKSSEPSLRYLELQITNRCNLRCRHCFIGGRRSKELSMKQIEKILMEFEEMQGLRVLITGGEPLLHSKFIEINEMLPRFFIRKVLFSNGLLLKKELLRNLHVDEIQISIDGLEDAHDSLRGKGTFRLAMKAVKLSVDSGFDVSIATMVHPKNLNDFDKMEKLFKEMGIKEWTVDVPCITGRLKENSELHISPEIGGKFLKYGYGGGLHSGAPQWVVDRFACGLHLMAVMADGKVSKCSFYSDKAVGRIEDGLRKCWKKIKPIKLDELRCDCDYIETCRGGCRYRAELLGDHIGKDFYKCVFYDINNR